MAGGNPIRHHYLPRAYLAGFTRSGDRDGRLYVFDVELRSVRRQMVGNVAVERNLHRVSISGYDPYLPETTLAEFENRAVQAIRNVCARKALEEGDLETLLNFAALTIARVPRFRKAIEREVETITNLPFAEAVMRPDAWSLVETWLPTTDLGWTKDDAPFMRNPQAKAAQRELWHFLNLSAYHDGFLRLLSQRHWSLLCVKDGAGDLISSDNPVTVLPSRRRTPYRQPSLGDPYTAVSFPLTRRLALVGSFEVPSGVWEIGDSKVAMVNKATLVHAWRCLYSASEDFLCLREDGTIGGTEYFWSILRDPSKWEDEV